MITATAVVSVFFGFQFAGALPTSEFVDIRAADAGAGRPLRGAVEVATDSVIESLKMENAALKRSVATLLGYYSDPSVASGTGCTAINETVSVTHMNVDFTQAGDVPAKDDVTIWTNANVTKQLVEGTETTIGTSSGRCVQMNDETVEIYGNVYGKVIDCDLTLYFDGSGGMQEGQLTVSGEYDAGDNMNGIGSELDVTGGTSNYEGATGEAVLSMDGNWDYALTVGCD